MQLDCIYLTACANQTLRGWAARARCTNALFYVDAERCFSQHHLLRGGRVHGSPGVLRSARSTHGGQGYRHHLHLDAARLVELLFRADAGDRREGSTDFQCASNRSLDASRMEADRDVQHGKQCVVNRFMITRSRNRKHEQLKTMQRALRLLKSNPTLR